MEKIWNPCFFIRLLERQAAKDSERFTEGKKAEHEHKEWRVMVFVLSVFV